MIIKSQKNSIVFLLLTLLPSVCIGAVFNDKESNTQLNESDIRLEHFNHLYKEIDIEIDANHKQRMGIVHIYSEAPDYSYAIEPAEGFTCVDDVARAVIMLAENQQFDIAHEERLTQLHQVKMMIEFILYMQNENGYFNNFIWHDYSINTEYKTSVAEMNWWTFRALWSLQTALPLIKEDQKLSNRVHKSISRTVVNLKRDLSHNVKSFDSIKGLKVPNWLPNNYAADQGALAIISLLPYYNEYRDSEVLDIINTLAKGLMAMQKGDADNYPYGMFLSWQNLWHSWGNNQAYSLLLAGQQLNNQEYIDSALLEVDNFYPFLLKNGFAEAIKIEKKSNQISQLEKKSFPQIAYGIRPMVFAAAKAYEITKKAHYLDLTNKIESWLLGVNDANTVMYNKSNGRIFDAVISNQGVNKNSGAESTVEGLLVLMKNKSLKVK